MLDKILKFIAEHLGALEARIGEFEDRISSLEGNAGQLKSKEIDGTTTAYGTISTGLSPANGEYILGIKHSAHETYCFVIGNTWYARVVEDSKTMNPKPNISFKATVYYLKF